MWIGRPLIVQSRDAIRVCHSHLPVDEIPPAESAQFRSSIQYRWLRASFCLMAFRFRARALECLAMQWGVFYLFQSHVVSLLVSHVEWLLPLLLAKLLLLVKQFQPGSGLRLPFEMCLSQSLLLSMCWRRWSYWCRLSRYQKLQHQLLRLHSRRSNCKHS